MSKPIHSYHVFLFPFKWEVYQNRKTTLTPFNSKKPLEKAVKQLNKVYWQKFTYKPAVEPNFNTYNEYSYFYDFARDVLCLDAKQQTIGISQYSYTGLQENTTYSINTGGKTYRLEVKEILLNLYENGVGILSFHLQNSEYTLFEDMLKINDFGRRIYPQFLGTEEGELTNKTKYSFLPNSITLQNIDTPTGKEVFEDFSHYNDMDNVVKAPFVLPAHIKQILGNRFVTKHELLLKDDIIVQPVFDDRMFVLSYAVDQKLIEQLAEWNDKENQYGYVNSNRWYEYVYVDGSGITCHSNHMKKDLILAATYDRWLGYETDGKVEGHLFGMSRYSMVMLTANAWFPTNIVFYHIKNMYFQIVLLCLLQRATIMVFSGEVARISDKLSNDFSKLYSEKSNFSRLYLWYIKFVNRIYFREVTPQEQGIEMYDKLQEQMRIRRDAEDLGKELGELNNFVETIQQGQLTLIAGRFVPPALVAAIFGVSTDLPLSGYSFWVALVGILLTLFLADYVIRLFLKK